MDILSYIFIYGYAFLIIGFGFVLLASLTVLWFTIILDAVKKTYKGLKWVINSVRSLRYA